MNNFYIGTKNEDENKDEEGEEDSEKKKILL
jgi:hypothetical protein